MTEQGTFEDGLSTLQLLGDPEPERLADVRAGCLPFVSNGRGRAVTTRWSPPGTAG